MLALTMSALPDETSPTLIPNCVLLLREPTSLRSFAPAAMHLPFCVLLPGEPRSDQASPLHELEDSTPEGVWSFELSTSAVKPYSCRVPLPWDISPTSTFCCLGQAPSMPYQCRSRLKIERLCYTSYTTQEKSSRVSLPKDMASAHGPHGSDYALQSPEPDEGEALRVSSLI